MKRNLLLLVILFGVFSILFAQGNPKALGAGKTYKNETGDMVYLFDSEQMDVLVQKIEKAQLLKVRAVLTDSLLVIRNQHIAVLGEAAVNDSTQMALLQESLEIYESFQPKWYQKFSVGYGSGVISMYLVLKLVSGL